jgi:hypothetical protein
MKNKISGFFIAVFFSIISYAQEAPPTKSSVAELTWVCSAYMSLVDSPNECKQQLSGPELTCSFVDDAYSITHPPRWMRSIRIHCIHSEGWTSNANGVWQYYNCPTGYSLREDDYTTCDRNYNNMQNQCTAGKEYRVSNQLGNAPSSMCLDGCTVNITKFTQKDGFWEGAVKEDGSTCEPENNESDNPPPPPPPIPPNSPPSGGPPTPQ